MQPVDILYKQLSKLRQLHAAGLELPLLQDGVVAEHQPFQVVVEEGLQEGRRLEVGCPLVVAHPVSHGSHVLLRVEDVSSHSANLRVLQHGFMQVIRAVVKEETVLAATYKVTPSIPERCLLSFDEEWAVGRQLRCTGLQLHAVHEVPHKEGVLQIVLFHPYQQQLVALAFEFVQGEIVGDLPLPL